ncbi:GatB/YqeY domain-containing protein [Cognatazoarcus halotolerans]|uniref:GatB/YqeY domain-containing protein n=1 Tax=Cognatazoarcus halotolerans TaxID=2686016 RepID=UPI00135A2F2A|nr:GatB/YqeY domain-containing protein [Cognatazoarcus halotolerans]MBX3681001.1 GatB/YqeY domain-containing protein [Rhodocyclaceae bacterium]MCB1900752.1 GatB/YqeY domain-containing protein [Rhodocyclaceae bacterium]MCP5311052.1 GatB/YqeY domain-containing protein [Zoogloeaceae bacterium]
MSLKNQITEDMKSAMRAKDAPRLSAIRMLLAAIKQREVDERIELDDGAVLGVVEKLIKQRRDSVSQYEGAGREDLASAERFEIEVLSAYMPAALSDAEVEAAVAAAIVESGAASPADMGKVMAIVKPRLAGRADMGKVSALVKAGLQKA